MDTRNEEKLYIQLSIDQTSKLIRLTSLSIMITKSIGSLKNGWNNITMLRGVGGECGWGMWGVELSL